MSILSPQSLIKQSLKLPSRDYLRSVIVGGILLMPIGSLADNHFSAWSDKTVCHLAQAQQDNSEYQYEAKQRGLSCSGSGTKNSSTTSQKVEQASAGIDIENDPNIGFLKPPMKPFPIDSMYWFGRHWQMGDYNNDGFSDVLYIGTSKPMNMDSTAIGTVDMCGVSACLETGASLMKV